MGWRVMISRPTILQKGKNTLTCVEFLQVVPYIFGFVVFGFCIPPAPPPPPPLSHTQFFHAQLYHTHNSVTHTQNSFTYNCFKLKIIDPSPSPLPFLPSPHCSNHCFCLLEEVDLWSCLVL